jgi:peptide-methionine (S)-S-oxide reductase
MKLMIKLSLILAAAVAIGCGVAASTASNVGIDTSALAPTPAKAADVKPGELQTAVFAGGCFWGVDAVFKHVKGVTDVKSGYAGGKVEKPDYEQVSSGDTGHAESVKVTYDPSKVSYTQLLTVFFSVAHDPTELNRQGPDVGTQYRSAIFYINEEQKKAATEYIAAIDGAKVFKSKVVTEVSPLNEFYEAEAYHQNYLAEHPTDPYIVYNDLPKLAALKKKFPELYK